MFYAVLNFLAKRDFTSAFSLFRLVLAHLSEIHRAELLAAIALLHKGGEVAEGLADKAQSLVSQ